MGVFIRFIHELMLKKYLFILYVKEVSIGKSLLNELFENVFLMTDLQRPSYFMKATEWGIDLMANIAESDIFPVKSKINLGIGTFIILKSEW